MYISHIRGEGAHLVDAVDELIDVARDTGVRAEIYHFKASGQANWPLFDDAVAAIERARAEGIEITADIYTYPAGATGLNASMPPWVQEGGFDSVARTPRRPRAAQAHRPRDARGVRRLGEHVPGAPARRRTSCSSASRPRSSNPTPARPSPRSPPSAAPQPRTPPWTSSSRTDRGSTRIYFSQSEDVLRSAVALPWVSFCSDEASPAAEGVFLKSNAHPRAYGSFARAARQVRPRREGPAPRRGHPQAHRSARRQSQARPPRPAPRGLLRRRRRLRPRDHPGPRDLRRAAPVRDRGGPRLRQRRPGPQGRRAHRRDSPGGWCVDRGGPGRK